MVIVLAGSTKLELDDIELEICRDVFETCSYFADEGIRPLDIFEDQRLYNYQDMFMYMVGLAFVWLGYELTENIQIKILITYRKHIAVLETRSRSKFNHRQESGKVTDEYILP